MKVDETVLAPLPSTPVRRIAYLGTPSLSATVLEALIVAGFEIALVVTPVDKKRGRGSALLASPVKAVAMRYGVPVVHRVEELLEEHHRHPLDLGVVVAYGSLIRPHVLAEIPMVNLHVSLLPRWRGAAPIERAILAGDESTGVCLMRLEEGLDTGSIISSVSMSLDPNITAASVGEALMRAGTDLLMEAMRSGNFSCVPQEGEPTYAAKIEPHERRIDWSESAGMVSRRVRIGEAWSTFRGRRLKIHSVELSDSQIPKATIRVEADAVFVGCGRGAVRLVEVQPEGRGRMTAAQWCHGAHPSEGETMNGA